MLAFNVSIPNVMVACPCAVSTVQLHLYDVLCQSPSFVVRPNKFGVNIGEQSLIGNNVFFFQYSFVLWNDSG